MKNPRRAFLKQAGILSSGVLLSNLLINCSSKKQPNILWIIGEDVCPDMGCYGTDLVHTPNIDRLANEGVRFNNAFTTAPVCSASRSAIMTGMYQTSIGAHNHRSHRKDGYKLPAGVKLVTELFRKNGYFTANIKNFTKEIKGTGKTDFNFSVTKPFDGNSWNQLKNNQPFFAQINFPEVHRKFKKAKQNPIDPAKVELPPYYPDHPIVRGDWALYLDTICYLDFKVGAVLKKLEEDELAENTIVFFFGDHGRAHIRGKQFLYEGGIHIPLLVRWPGNLKAGEVNDDLVSAIDITAASLEAAGIKLPENMEGRPFLGKTDKQREFIIAARDRCDETVDRIRCVRTKRYKYIRNYYPERPYTQLNRYKEKYYPMLKLMRRLKQEGKLTPEQALFFADKRPKEELYDLQNDPFELNNLADKPGLKNVLNGLRDILDNWITVTKDQGENPEPKEVVDYWENFMKERHGY